MPSGEQRFQIESSDKLLVERLPDGSIAIFNQITQSVHSLNAISAATFEACQQPATIQEIRAAIEHRTGTAVGQEIAEYAVSELQGAGLVSGPTVDRRSVLAGIAASMVPVVLTMTMVEQRAYAQSAGSGTVPPTPGPTTTPAPTTTSVPTTVPPTGTETIDSLGRRSIRRRR